MLPGPVGPGLFPPDDRLAVVALASDAPADHDAPVTRWSLDELAFRHVNETAAKEMSRSTIFRILRDADLKPHRSVYWLNSHDPDFNIRAQAIGKLYLEAIQGAPRGHLVLCTDEKTGMQILERKHPTQLARPGHPEKREHEYIRHGTRALITSLVVSTGEIVADLGPTRTASDFADHLVHGYTRFQDWKKITWVVDNLNTHWSLAVCEMLAWFNRKPFHPEELATGAQRRAFVSDPSQAYRLMFTPRHGSWLNQVELWFSVLTRQFLKRGDFRSPAEFEERLMAYVKDYNERKAKPYRWTYTGEPLVRGVAFAEKRRQAQAGRAWFGTRPQRYERYLYPLRPYRRRKAG
jgi:transposase